MNDFSCREIGDSRTTEHMNMGKKLFPLKFIMLCDCRRLTFSIILHENREKKNIDKGNSIVIYRILVLVTGIELIIVASLCSLHINMIDEINKNSDSNSF